MIFSRQIIKDFIPYISKNSSRLYSYEISKTNSEVIKKRNGIFEKEKLRQMSLIPRIEKIQVKFQGESEECSLLMNKNLSTPFNCAMHISELLMSRSVLALVNDMPWDMHRPLVDDCNLRFVHFKDEDPFLVNQVFWRSCSMILGYVLENAFQESHYVQLCSFPKPEVRSMSFVYDADLGLNDWTPSQMELMCLSRIGYRLQNLDLKFERLDVDASLAQAMFADNRFKREQVPSIAAMSPMGSTVPVYRFGTHVDMSQGPMMSSTSLLGRFSVTAVHDIETDDFGKLQRIQGIATPNQLPLHWWAYSFLETQSRQKNKATLPRLWRLSKQLYKKENTEKHV